MGDKYQRMLDLLLHADDWVTAGELADQLGVTTRSVRSYVAAAKSAAHPLPLLAASTAGYRLDTDAYARFAETSRPRDQVDTPQGRAHHLVRRLAEAPGEGLDIHALAESLFISESTLDADLRKVKALAEECGAVVVRAGSNVRLTGTESATRRLLSRLLQNQSTRGVLDLETIESEFGVSGLGAFKTELIHALEADGFYVNDYGTDAVLLHTAIAVDRARHDQHLPDDAPGSPTAHDAPIVAALARLVPEHFDVVLTGPELDYLTRMLTTRVIAPGAGTSSPADVDPGDIETVRRIVSVVAEEYLIDFLDEAFITRLAIHLGNLVSRARENTSTRNPLTRSIKSSYPMIFDIAVFIASIIQRERNITVDDDEISYIALHLGSHLERAARQEELVTATIVCPSYYDLHAILRKRIESELGSDLQIEFVVTRTDVDPRELTSDLVLSTIPSPARREGFVAVQPFLTDDDIGAIRQAVSRVRRQRRRARITEQLLEYFEPALFFADPPGNEPEAVIRGMGAAMIRAGVVDEAYIEGVVARERLSSTAFTDTLAVPHAMGLSADRTAIAIALCPTPLGWGDARVHVVALMAFSATGRARFQPLFDQFIDVFSSRREVTDLVRDARDFDSFITELAKLIERG
jgi:lichenan operon transcriptional antiterminator